MLNKEKGITLIALVITIIVLLILAGVSIAMLTGQNGILTQASNASEATIKGEAEEAVKLAINTIMANKSAATAGVPAGNTTDFPTELTAGNIVDVMKQNNSACVAGFGTNTETSTSATGTGSKAVITYKNNSASSQEVSVTVENGAVTEVEMSAAAGE